MSNNNNYYYCLRKPSIAILLQESSFKLLLLSLPIIIVAERANQACCKQGCWSSHLSWNPVFTSVLCNVCCFTKEWAAR